MEPDNLKKIAINTIKEIYKAKDKPVFVSLKSLKKAVPQYNTDYYDVLQKIAAFEAENPGCLLRVISSVVFRSAIQFLALSRQRSVSPANSRNN